MDQKMGQKSAGQQLIFFFFASLAIFGHFKEHFFVSGSTPGPSQFQAETPYDEGSARLAAAFFFQSAHIFQHLDWTVAK